ncbi:MAG TPA: hypothetical protein VFL30_01895 [Rhodanobacteraceae bacterium]|nr:hypothetical protein [Rhodanobacteraceae bacterium]
MLSKRASRLRALVAAIGLLVSPLAGAGGDGAARGPALPDPEVHDMSHGDTPHDSFASAKIGFGPLATA